MENRVLDPTTFNHGPDDFISVSEAVHYIPGRPSEGTIRNWMKRGFVIVHSGQEHVIRLPYRRPGSLYLTTRRWIAWFEEERQTHQSLARAENGDH